LIFSLYPRVKLKLGGEEHVYDASRLMFTEVAEIEKVTGQTYMEWERSLHKYSISAIAALLHVLRKRAGTPSDFLTMEFNAADLECIPLREDGTEFTAPEIVEDIRKRLNPPAEEPDPTTAAAEGGTTTDQAPEPQAPATTTNGISPISPLSSASSPGNGSTSPGVISSAAGLTSTGS
jgi:hypothetical protein